MKIQLPQNPYVMWTEKRIKRNKNAIIMINGPTGSGKSYAGIDLALSISKALGTSFTIKENMDFSFPGLLQKMQYPQNAAPGTVFLFEEVGSVGSGSSYREWQSKSNAFFQSFMQTSRHKNQVLILTTPMFGYLEKGVRELVHLQITMKNINPQNKTSTGKPFLLQANPISAKIYMKYLRVRYRGASVRVNEITFKIPPPNYLKEYEHLKLQFTTKLNQSILSSIEEQGKPKRKAEIDLKELTKFHNKGLTRKELANLFKVSPKTVQNSIARARDEGLIPPYVVGSSGMRGR